MEELAEISKNSNFNVDRNDVKISGPKFMEKSREKTIQIWASLLDESEK
jgi:hypothetical protein